MQFVKLSDTYGINLDHVLQWFDYPTVREPFLNLITTVALATEDTDPQPYTIRLSGEYRLKMLRMLDEVDGEGDWKREYEALRDEQDDMARQLMAYQAAIASSQRACIKERVRGEEEIDGGVAEAFDD